MRGPGFEPGQADASGSPILGPDLKSAPFVLARAPPPKFRIRGGNKKLRLESVTKVPRINQKFFLASLFPHF